jgi:hypothetical protein
MCERRRGVRARLCATKPKENVACAASSVHQGFGGEMCGECVDGRELRMGGDDLHV